MPLLIRSDGDSASDRWVQRRRPTRTYDLIADLPVRIDEYALEGLEGRVSSVFTSRSSSVRRSR